MTLLATLEAATAGSRELDAEIAKAIKRLPENWTDEDTRMSYEIGADVVEPFTTSVDTALTLMPDTTINQGQRLWYVDIEGLLGEWPVVTCGRNDQEAFLWRGQARTAPLAVCIAALRARLPGAA